MLIPERMWRYKECSKIFKDVLRVYDEKLTGVGLDELYLDVTDYCKAHDIETEEQKLDLASKLRAQVFEALKLTCSAGIGPNKMLSKIASEQKKPDGQFLIPFDSEKIEEFMKTFMIRNIPGVGKVKESELKILGIE